MDRVAARFAAPLVGLEIALYLCRAQAFEDDRGFGQAGDFTSIWRDDGDPAEDAMTPTGDEFQTAPRRFFVFRFRQNAASAPDDGISGQDEHAGMAWSDGFGLLKGQPGRVGAGQLAL